jgi:hypothetical protein
MSMQCICTIQRRASSSFTSGKSTSRELPSRGKVRKRFVGIQSGMPLGASFWKNDPPAAPSRKRFIVNGRFRRWGTSAGATAA